MTERWGRSFRELFDDILLAARALASDRLFSTAAVVTLALGIGANTAMFTLVNAVWLRPPPVGDPASVAVFYSRPARATDTTVADRFSWDGFRMLQRGTGSLASVAAEANPALHAVRVSLPGGEPIRTTAVSENYFQVLGVTVRGRLFEAADDLPGAPPVAIISHDLWSSRFGSDPGIVGRAVSLSRQPTVVVGVAASGFRGPRLGDSTDLWIPLHAAAWFLPSVPPDVFLRMPHVFLPLRLYARLREGVPVSQAQAEVAALGLTRGSVTVLKTLAETAYPARVQTSESEDQDLAWLLGATAIVVLLVGCANLAALLLARAERRAGDVAIRVALGIPRARLIRLLGGEALLLAMLGGVVALGVSACLLQTLRSFSLPTGIAISTLNLEPDWRVLTFTAAVSLVAMLACSAAPVRYAFRPNIAGTLVARGATSTRSHTHVRSWLLGGHVALALVLLIGAALFTASVRRAFTKDLGFDNDRTAFVVVTANLARYANAAFDQVDTARWAADCTQLTDELRSVPGVTSVTEGFSPLLASAQQRGPRTPVALATDHGVRSLPLATITSGRDFFATLGAGLVVGRDFAERDLRADAPQAVVVNEALARHLWPSENPLGKRLWFDRSEARPRPERERTTPVPTTGGQATGDADLMHVIGVTRLSARDGVRGPEVPTLYRPDARSPEEAILSGPRALAVRTASTAAAMIPRITAVVRRVFPDAYLMKVSTAAEEVSGEMMRERMGARLFSWFALVALGLSVVGIWGLVSYCVAAHTHEMAVRLALGAPAERLVRSMAWRGLGPVVVGCAVGLAGAAAAQHLISAFLFEIGSLRAVLFAGCAALLFAISAGAAIMPARRVLGLDPAETLRAQ